MPDQNQIDLEMRLSAMEYMLGKLFSVVLKANVQSDQQMEAGLDKIAEDAKTQKFPGLDPAMHDLVSDEYASAIRRLTDMIKAMAKAL
jgi:hypothetical protein